MNVINLSKNAIRELKYLPLSQHTINTEATIYKMKYQNQDKILKSLYFLNGERFANKLYTVEMLNYYKDILPTSFCIPDNIVTQDNKIIGFTLPYIEGKNLADILKEPQENYPDKLESLKKIGELLDQLNGIRKYSELKDLYINDLHESNFLISKNDSIKVIDLDSCKIKNNKPAPARFLRPNTLFATAKEKYNITSLNTDDEYVTPSNDTELYCYNMMILNCLYGKNVNSMKVVDYYNYLSYLSYLKIDNNLLNSFQRLLTNCENTNPYPYLESLTQEQIYRSNYKVYKYNKK